MSPFRNVWQRFYGHEAGNVAVLFSLALLPIFGAAGAAVDYGRAVESQSSLRTQSDAMALRLAISGDPKKPITEDLKATASSLVGGNAQNVSFAAEWINPTDLKVTAKGSVPVTILGAVPGMPDKLNVEVVSIARVTQTIVQKKPRMLQLDPEAGDYNQLFAYCFEPSGKGLGSNTGGDHKGRGSGDGRTQMTLIADNAGSSYTFEMPQCQAGTFLSFRLRNVRNARGDRSKWESTTAEQYNWYSDTTITPGGATKYNFTDGVQILESVQCASIEECKPVSQGGVIPTGKNRNPNAAWQTCKKGAFMYYGWEDRPPGYGWTDRDYDDIRVIIECPDSTGERRVTLIQ